MIFIDIHDNPDNIAKEKDITLCLADFNSENISSLVSITFYIEEKLYKISFNIGIKLKTSRTSVLLLLILTHCFKTFLKPLNL